MKVDGNKETALHYAKKNKHIHVVNYIQELKQNVKKSKEMAKMESSQQEEKMQRKKK